METKARLAGRIAIVTGAASSAGIGFATAQRLADEGASVALTDVDEQGVLARADELCAGGALALGLGHDVTSADDWQRVLDACEARLGGIDVLVNNAGIVVLRTLDELELVDWQRQIDVNLTSVYLGCRAAVERMRRHGRGGSIVNVSSMAGLVGIRRCTAYGASKGGIRLFSKSLALETAAEGIRVNSVHPGVIETDIQKVAMSDGGEQSARVHAMIPMQRKGRPKEVAAMIAFLASDDAGYVTGGEFAIDGGMTAQ